MEKEQKESKLHCNFVHIEPELAAKLLNGHANQADPTLVSFLAYQLKTGAWNPVATTVKMTESSKVIEGQCWLEAIVQAQQPAPVFLARGFVDLEEAMQDEARAQEEEQAEVQEAEPTPVDEPCGDEAEMSEEYRSQRIAKALLPLVHKYERTITAACNVIAHYNSNIRLTAKGLCISPARALAIVNRYPKIVELAGRGTAIQKEFGNGGILTAAQCFTDLADSAMSEEFWEKVRSGCGLEEGSPEFVLRKKLPLYKRKDQRADYFNVVVDIWNRKAFGKHIGKRYARNEEAAVFFTPAGVSIAPDPSLGIDR